MKFIFLGIFCLLIFYSALQSRAIESVAMHRAVSTVSVREALLGDLQKIYDADKEVSFEHFVPVYENIGKSNKLPELAEKLLRDELEADITLFRDAVNHRGVYRLFVAFDSQTQECCGFSLFSTKDNKNVTLDLLLVRAKFRGKGVGKELIKHALATTYEHASKCMVFPFKHGNDGALKFYEKLGFKCLGNGPAGHPCVLGKFEELYYAYALDLSKRVAAA